MSASGLFGGIGSQVGNMPNDAAEGQYIAIEEISGELSAQDGEKYYGSPTRYSANYGAVALDNVSYFNENYERSKGGSREKSNLIINPSFDKSDAYIDNSAAPSQQYFVDYDGEEGKALPSIELTSERTIYTTATESKQPDEPWEAESNFDAQEDYFATQGDFSTKVDLNFCNDLDAAEDTFV